MAILTYSYSGKKNHYVLPLCRIFSALNCKCNNYPDDPYIPVFELPNNPEELRHNGSMLFIMKT